MTKQELVNVVAQEVAIPQKTVNAVLESVIGKIKSAITSGDDVSIRGFGTFTMKHRAEKKARDIHHHCSCQRRSVVQAQQTVFR